MIARVRKGLGSIVVRGLEQRVDERKHRVAGLREGIQVWGRGKHHRERDCHGKSRDLFAPAAAHLAAGAPFEDLGPPLPADSLVRLDLPVARFSEGTIDAMALFVDSFGNIALNLTRDDVESVGVVPGTRLELEITGERYYAVAARTFADARTGDVILYEDSYRNMCVAISRGNAAALLHAEPGQELTIRLADASSG